MRRLGRGDDGTSLAELLVAIMLMALIGSITLVATIAVNGVSRRTTVQQNDAQAARVALDAMTRTLRAATSINTSPVTVAFISAAPTDVSFYSNNYTVTGSLTNTGPALERFYVDSGNNLVEESTQATANAVGSTTPYSWPTISRRRRVLAVNVPLSQPVRTGPNGAQAAGGAIFSFSDRYGAAVSFVSGTVPVAALPNIRQVDIALSVRTTTSPAVQATSLFSHVQIVNGYDPDGSSS